jgi:hypothetical protein
MSASRSPDRTPDQLAETLSRASAWSTKTSPIHWIQTHISHVFLVGDRVFKLRKSVCLSFLDFGSTEARNADCLREVALNRRLASTVYLGVAPILCEGDSISIGPIQESLYDATLEHVVVMRRLTEGRDALALLEGGQLEFAHIEAIADRLETFHAVQALGRPAPWSESSWFKDIADPTLACLPAIAESKAVPDARLTALEATARERLEGLRPHFESRRQHGCAVDGHGDLHLDHVWFEGSQDDPLIIDCVEFSDDLRRIDRASEVAFLAMDLRYRDRADLAEAFLDAYANRVDDHDLFGVVDFFTAYRALVRAKVAALATQQPTIEAAQRDRARRSALQHLELAESLLETRSNPELIVLCGSVGSGKSSVARHLARTGHGISIASDRVRKILAGLPIDTHQKEAPDQGLYRPDQKDAVYHGLLERAAPILDSGRNAILDASFSRRRWRDLARAWARDHQTTIRLVEVRCDSAVALARLRERERVGADPSDAGPDFLPISRERFESPSEWPESDRLVIHSDDDDWSKQIEAIS